MNVCLRTLGRSLAALGLCLSFAAARADEADDQFTVAAAHYNAARWELAATEFATLLERFPAHERAVDSRFFLGESLLQTQRYREAAEQFGTLANDKNLTRFARQSLARSGEALYLSGDVRAAEAVLREFHAKHPGDPLSARVTPYLAAALLRLEKPADAEKLFDESLAKYPDGPLSAMCRLGLAEAAEKQERWDEAMRRYEKLTSDKIVGTAESAGLRLGVIHYRQGRYAEALKQLDAVLKSQDPERRARALACQGTVLLSSGRHQEAIAPLRACLELQPQGPDAVACCGQLAACYAREGQFAQARSMDRDLEANHASDPSRPSATLALAEGALAAGSAAWAAELFDRVLKTKPAQELRLRALSGLGRSQLAAGKNLAAAETFAQLIAAKPEGTLLVDAALLRGSALSKLERRADALAAYMTVVDSHPEDARWPLAILHAAEISEQLGRKDAAVKLYDRFLAHRPAAAERDLALYRSAWLLKENQQAEDAVTRFRTIHEKHRGSRFWADATFRIAEAEFKAKRFAKVRQLLADLSAAAPPLVLREHLWYLDAQRAIAEGKWDEAEPPLEKLVSERPESKLRLAAEFWLAEAAYRQEHYEQASNRFEALAPKIGDRRDSWLAMVPLRKAQLAVLKSDWKAARRFVEESRQSWPDFEQQHELDYILGRCLAAGARFDDAREAYRRVITSATAAKSETAAMAQWMIGESYLHQEKHEEALREYLRVEALYAYPHWQAASLLQAGKCYESLGRWSDAALLYERIVKQYSQTTFREEAQRRLRLSQESNSPKRA